MKLGKLTIDLDEVLKRSIALMEGDTDVSYPIRMALKEMHRDIIGELEDRMVEQYRQHNPEGESK